MQKNMRLSGIHRTEQQSGNEYPLGPRTFKQFAMGTPQFLLGKSVNHGIKRATAQFEGPQL